MSILFYLQLGALLHALILLCQIVEGMSHLSMLVASDQAQGKEAGTV